MTDALTQLRDALQTVITTSEHALVPRALLRELLARLEMENARLTEENARLTEIVIPCIFCGQQHPSQMCHLLDDKFMNQMLALQAENAKLLQDGVKNAKAMYFSHEEVVRVSKGHFLTQFAFTRMLRSKGATVEWPKGEYGKRTVTGEGE